MSISRILIANRGEIAIRIARAAHDIGIETVAVYTEDDATSLHHRMSDQARELSLPGVKGYLNIDELIEIAKNTECDAVHPGYGFLAESGEFAKRCLEAGLNYIGPRPEMLDLFGSKGQARAAAVKAGVPVIKGTDKATTLEEAEAFYDSLESGAMIIKAVAGGGGRGTRMVMDRDSIPGLFERCQSEAKTAFGNGDLYVEELMPCARHIEVQIVGDGHGHVVHLGERECSVQRRHQKIIEIAPAPNLSEDLRTRIWDAAVSFAKDVRYDNLGTFEFLVDATEGADSFAFIEVNARLQVEHTVTEEVTGIDLVQTQIQIAGGKSLHDLGLDPNVTHTSMGYAIQTRVCMETMTPEGDVRPSGGTLTAYDIPSGLGVRTDGFGYANYTTSPSFDSLLAKVIAHSRNGSFEDTLKRVGRALSEFRIEGVQTNIPFLQTMLKHPDMANGKVYTRWVDDNVAELVGGDADHVQRYHAQEIEDPNAGLAGAQLETDDPLALFAHDAAVTKAKAKVEVAKAPVDLKDPDGSIGLPAPMQGTVISILVSEGDEVYKGQDLVILEAMKMEHHIAADRDGVITRFSIEEGHVVQEGYPLVYILEQEIGDVDRKAANTIDLDEIRGDLQETYDRHAYTLDENRPDAVERRRKTNQRTARENIMDICDDGTFKEYGPLVITAQTRRHELEYLRRRYPADGLICGVGSINGDLFGRKQARAIAVAYDYTVLAGTQGSKNHYKQDRIFELAHRYGLPVVLFSEGGGGRPGDTDKVGGVGMDSTTFTQWSQLSGRVPMVGVNSGYCFAGNTVLLACCDVIIATEDSTIGMGGPAMIEGGKLGVFTPKEIAPMSTQVPNGVVDILVKDEEAATKCAKKYLSYFQGDLKEWEENDPREMRHIVPENRAKIYDMRDIIENLADKDSLLEIRREFGIGIITCLVRVEGKPCGLVANNPHHLAGAIDSDGSDKGARFLQLCDAFDLPVISLMDCPGMMVGPEVETTALVRHCARMFNTGANLSVPMFGVIIRKAYGLGVMAMCGAGSMVPFFSVCWPTAEFAGMNIEGSVKLAFRKDLEAIEDPQERLDKYNEMVETAYERAKAVNAAQWFGVDDVIDPAKTRSWIATGLNSLPDVPKRETKKRPYIDTW
jgi:acetyl/propionyl-CoA carboxylase alpha subunit